MKFVWRALPKIDKHFEALAWIRGLLIEPHTGPVTLIRIATRQHAVGTRLNIQIGTNPPQSIFAVRISSPVEPSRLVPDLVKAVFGVVKHAVLERAGNRTIAVVHPQRRFGPQNRTCRVNT